jgi:hypothetical protein
MQLRVSEPGGQKKIRVALAAIDAVASARPPGYIQAIMAAGLVVDDMLEIESEALAEIATRYHVTPPRCPGCGG